MTNNGIGFQKVTTPSTSTNGNSVYIYSTTNDWQTATVITAASSAPGCCEVKIEFIDDSIGVKVLTKNNIDSISITKDAGNTWVHWFTSSNISKIQLLNDSTLFFANRDSISGLHVNRIINQQQKVIYSANNIHTYLSGNGIHFLDSINGYVISVDPTQSVAPNILKKTTDAGFSWFDVFPQSGSQVSCLKFQNSTTGYFGNNNGHIYKTTNSGIIWRLIQTPISSNVNDIEFGQNNSVYAASQNGVLIKSCDSGVSWITESVGTSKNLIDIHTMENASIVYVVANDGEIFKNSLATGIPLLKKSDHSISIYPNPTSDFISLNSTKEITRVTILNTNGEAILESNEVTIDVSSLSQGLYFLHVMSSATSSVIKFIKK